MCVTDIYVHYWARSMPSTLQSVLNTAARLLVGAMKHDHIRHVLMDRLHRVPVPQRVQFKVCLLTFKTLHGLAPSYHPDPYRPVISVGSRLRSATRVELFISSTVTNFGARSFCCSNSQRLEPAVVTHTCDPVGQLLQNCSEDVSVFVARLIHRDKTHRALVMTFDATCPGNPRVKSHWTTLLPLIVRVYLETSTYCLVIASL